MQCNQAAAQTIAKQIHEPILTFSLIALTGTGFYIFDI